MANCFALLNSICRFVSMERKKYKYCGYWLDEETRKRLHRLKQMANKDNGPSDRVVTMTEIITQLINTAYDKANRPMG